MASRAVGARELAARVPFDAYHQSGIITPKAAQATMIALDSIAPTTTALFEGLQAISTEARQLSQGEPVGVAEIDDPPPDSGILGPYNAPDSLTVTVAYGASLFDHRYGLARKRPPHLTGCRAFALDELDPRAPAATCCSRSAPASATPSCTPCASCCARSPDASRCAG